MTTTLSHMTLRQSGPQVHHRLEESKHLKPPVKEVLGAGPSEAWNTSTICYGGSRTCTSSLNQHPQTLHSPSAHVVQNQHEALQDMGAWSANMRCDVGEVAQHLYIDSISTSKAAGARSHVDGLSMCNREEQSNRVLSCLKAIRDCEPLFKP